MAGKEEHLKHLVSEDLLERLEAARKRRDTHWARYQTATQDCEALERVIGLVERPAEDTGSGDVPREYAPREDATLRDDATRADYRAEHLDPRHAHQGRGSRRMPKHRGETYQDGRGVGRRGGLPRRR